MAVDSKAKGARAELKIRDELRELTGHNWERVPASGALSVSHKLKGDLYIPEHKNIFCVEVKHYADDHITSKVLTDSKPTVDTWWEQTIREAGQIEKMPLLIFKFDRSKTFCAVPANYFDSFTYGCRYLYVGHLDIYIMKLADFINIYKPKFIE